MSLISDMYDAAAQQAERAAELCDVVLTTPDGELPDQDVLEELIAICEVEAHNQGGAINEDLLDVLKELRA